MDAVFEVEIQQAQVDGTFVARVLRSAGGGQPSAEFRLDVDQLMGQRGLFEATVLSSAVSARRIMSSMETTVQRVGLVLFTSVFTGEVGAAYRTSAAVAHERGAGLKLVLRLTPELAALPWESLYDPETGGYLSRQEPLVRTVPAGYTSEPLAVDPPLRILGIVSSPRDLQRLDTALERARLENAIRSQLDAGLVELVWLDDVSWSGLHSMLLEQKWHILHFVGHGGFDVATDEGQLALVREDGRADFVSASSLADLLREADPSPRLVVLNSCMSGAVSED
ncbi:MAG TPA: CHAT domain-containing protein, partial [Agromyces sp.]|nr:CHAT domain-containing protein [Agromyces sp.]